MRDSGRILSAEIKDLKDRNKEQKLFRYKPKALLKIIIYKYMNVLKSIKNASFNLKNRIFYFFQL